MSPINERDSLYNIDKNERIWRAPARRMWFYMPLEHSESMDDHVLLDERTKDMMEAVSANGDDRVMEFIQTFIGFQEQHRAIIARFGRYPHRNGSLGRPSTAEEKAYMDGGGHTFGTGSSKQ